MRYVAWAFVVCTLLSAIGAFVPCVELEIGGFAVHKRTALSLYRASTDRELVRHYLASYGRNRRFGASMLGVLQPHAGKRVRSNLDDVHDAMTTLDSVTDDDVVTGARVFAIALWTFLGLHVVMGIAMFVETMNNTFRKRGVVTALVVSVLVTVMAFAINWACREAVFEANDELGVPVLGTAVGAWLIPIAATGATVSAIALLVLRARANRTTART